MVVMALRFEDAVGGECAGDVQVAICARRRTVSSGNLMDKSIAEPRNVAILQLAGFIAGSSPRYDFSTTGVLVDMSVGRVDVKKVMGRR
jgi:hypothetical protein